MKKFFSRPGDWMFVSIASGLFLLLVGYAVYTISFVAARVNDTLRPAGEGEELIENFDFDKLNQLLGSVSPPPPAI